jgi:hypothetical protein
MRVRRRKHMALHRGVIRDNGTGSTLFAGRVVNPQAT